MGTNSVVSTLIVEDNQSFRVSLREILAARFPQMAVNEVGSGEEALERMESLRPDLMFVDIRLPGQNGLELTRQVRKDHTEVVIVILTNYDLPEFREAAYQYGVNYFFSKSTSSMEEIVTAVEVVLRQKGEARGDLERSPQDPISEGLN
jgi:DNA-binding NarL/FixJ family response regulator